MKIRRLQDTTYRRPLFFVFGCDADELNAYFKKTKKIEPVDKDTSGQFWQFENESKNVTEFWIWIRGKDIAKVRLEHLVHETAHMAINVLAYCGIKLTNESEEAFVYYQESIFRQCLIFLNQEMKTKRICKKITKQRSAKLLSPQR